MWKALLSFIQHTNATSYYARVMPFSSMCFCVYTKELTKGFFSSEKIHWCSHHGSLCFECGLPAHRALFFWHDSWERFPATATRVENHTALSSVFGFREWLTCSLKSTVCNWEQICPQEIFDKVWIHVLVVTAWRGWCSWNLACKHPAVHRTALHNRARMIWPNMSMVPWWAFLP